MNNIALVNWAMDIALVVANRSTCPKRSVGTVFLDKKGRILATGYNGAPRVLSHCKPYCEGDCNAVHAEINALIQCKNVNKVYYIITTCAPCRNCLKALLNTNVAVLVYKDTHNNMEEFYKIVEEKRRLKWWRYL